jgi:hypothetical protein
MFAREVRIGILSLAMASSALLAQPTPAPTPGGETPSAAPTPAAPATAVGVTAAVSPAPLPRPYLDVLKLKQAGMSDQFLLNKVRTENVRYDLTTDEILQLRNAGLPETVIEAMRASGQPKEPGLAVARRAEFSGLARVGKGFLGVFGTSTKSVGKLVIDGDSIQWFENADPSKNFTVYTQNVKEIFNTCVLRPGKNLCLEFGIVTHTGETYRFREPGWKNGDNRSVLDATTYFKMAFPNLFFTERAVNEL